MNRITKHKVHNNLRKSLVLAVIALLYSFASAQTPLLRLSDTISVNDPAFIINAGGIGSNTGSNQWIINSEYNGHGVYPNTISEDSVLAGLGQITRAPYSTYLHIHDAANPGGAANANWNPATASDRFAFMPVPFCTAGLDNVIFTFFWTGQGDTTAYGRVYFSTNGGGTWQQCGQTKYNNQSDWKYEQIHDARFDNQPNLQFGFRWINSGSDTTKDASWGIDDIIAVGTYDSINNPAVLSILNISPDTVCQSGNITVTFSLNPPLCYGSYLAFISDSVGNFNHTTFLQPPFNLDASSIYWQTTLDIPNNLEGTCFKIVIRREGPDPVFESDTSLCFTIQHCPVSINTNSAPVLTDPDTACLKSAIDIFFNSFGNFNNNNIYYAQLSDSNGSFAHPDTIGHLTSNQAYPAMPGDVSGLIPTSVPPGCGYYVRVVSSDPASIGNVIGPFCMTKCDVTTNNTIDLHACINYPYPTDTLRFTITPDQWNQGASYDTCNNWSVELLDMMSLTVLNVGGLGIYHDSTGGTFTMIVGPQNTLPVAPGSYYLRIISNCTNEPWNQNGTMIRIQIGAPDPNITVISTQGNDSVYCNTDVMVLYPNPDNYPNSEYYWTSNVFNPIGPIPGGVSVDLHGVVVGDFVAYVQEETNGCYGPKAPYHLVTTARPVGQTSGPVKICLGDTAVFNATYFPATYYNWTAPPGSKIVVQSNSQTSIVFDSLGSFTVGELSVNNCGSSDNSLPIKVYNLFDVNLGPNKLNCIGDSITLATDVPPYPKTFISLDSSISGNQGGMFNIHAHSDIIIDSFAVSFRSRVANTKTAIYSKPGSYRTFEQTATSWSLLVKDTIALPSPVFSKTVIPSELNKRVAADDTIAFYITTYGTPVVNEAYGNALGIQQGTVFKSDGYIDFIQGTENAYPFGASFGPKVLDVTIYYRTQAGLKYIWNTGDTTASISFVPTQSGQYSVEVYDTTGCKSNDTVLVKVDTLPKVYAGPDTLLCPNGGYIMPATASPTASIAWSPVNGLDFPDTLRPVFNYNQTTDFIVTATNPDGCKGYDSVNISVYPLSVDAGPDTTLCDAQSYIMLGMASNDSIEWFPSAGLSAINILNPVFSYDQTTVYHLQVSDIHGCTLTDSVTITVVYCNTYIKTPDAFSPNGDGNNDHFTVFGQYISDYHIKIFNRWGEEVYSSDNVNELNDLSRGWDGTYKGKIQDVGTFVYVIEAKDLNGKSVLKKGNITLIR